MTDHDDPFTVLDLEPTLDRGAIKRAYFRLLPSHSPHVDPPGFRRLRDAYERLMGPGLVDAWASAAIDVEAELLVLGHQLDASIAQAQRERADVMKDQLGIAAFESLLRLNLERARTQVVD